MQNVKYHALNIISIMVFSLILASTINQIVKYNISPVYSKTLTSSRKMNTASVRKSFDDDKVITDSGFLKVASASDLANETQSSAGSISELTLLGTITGPTSIERAMILKTGEKSPGIFALFKVNNEISNDVYGHKLVWIADSRVYLEVSGQKLTLDLYAKKSVEPTGQQIQGGDQSDAGGQQFTQTLSRAEIRQKVFNNMD